jgi:hypothetical protein
MNASITFAEKPTSFKIRKKQLFTEAGEAVGSRWVKLGQASWPKAWSERVPGSQPDAAADPTSLWLVRL